MPSRDGGWVHAWRVRNGFSQSELALEFDVSRQTIVGWEKSDKVSRLVELALIGLESTPDAEDFIGRASKRRRSIT